MVANWKEKCVCIMSAFWDTPEAHTTLHKLLEGFYHMNFMLLNADIFAIYNGDWNLKDWSVYTRVMGWWFMRWTLILNHDYIDESCT